MSVLRGQPFGARRAFLLRISSQKSLFHLSERPALFLFWNYVQRETPSLEEQALRNQYPEDHGPRARCLSATFDELQAVRQPGAVGQA
ncbi:hypothetical protein ACM7LX_06100 [Pseudomonas aeruginosa]|uniref:hypothetical protein n=1 Tax=Pseudomonas aeruginosa TaxID=287 RepID=UPI003AD5CE23